MQFEVSFPEIIVFVQCFKGGKVIKNILYLSLRMDNIWTFFTFPLNLLLAVLWMAGWRWLWRRCPSSAVMRFMLSPAATVLSIVLLTVSCLWLGFSGDRDFVRSVSFVAMLLFVQTVVYLIILRGWRRADGVIRWRFLLIHAGFLLAVGAGFWGSPDSEELRMLVYLLQLNQSLNMFYNQ